MDRQAWRDTLALVGFSALLIGTVLGAHTIIERRTARAERQVWARVDSLRVLQDSIIELERLVNAARGRWERDSVALICGERRRWIGRC